jgi:O-antigen/teichoic acid export membrane protein
MPEMTRMLEALRPSAFIKDLVLTTGTSIATGFSLIMATRLLAQGLGPEGFGVYSLSRRVLATMVPFSTLAMGITIARYIALFGDADHRTRFLLSGLILSVAPSLGVAVIGLIVLNPLSTAIFHDTGYSPVFIATLFMLVGSSFYTVLYAFYRGTGQMGKANLWQLVTVGLGPIVIAGAYANTGRVDWILLLMGTLFFTSAVPLSVYASKGVLSCKHGLRIAGPLKELFQYGLPRTLGGLALAGILSTGPLLASYFGSLKDAGYLVAGQSMFAIADVAGIASFGIIALPKAAQLFAEGRMEFLRERIGDILALVFHLGLFTAIQLFLWSDQIILAWLGSQYIHAIPLMRILILALVPYFAYVGLRSIIDAVEERAVNTYNLCVGLITTLVSSLFLGMVGSGSLGLALGTTLGIVALGSLTVRYLWQANWVAIKGLRLKECLCLNTCALGLAFWFRISLVHSYGPMAMLGFAVILEGMLIVLYLLILRKLRVSWIIELERRVYPRSV